MDDLQAAGRGRRTEIALFDQGGGEAAECCLAGQSGAIDSAANNHDVKFMV